MSKVYIIHENMDWTRHLIKRLDELEVPYEEWDLSTGSIDLTEKPPEGIFYNRMSASSHTRGHRYAPELTANVLEWLEQYNAPVYNGTRALDLELSKVKQYLALNKVGIKTPTTYAASGKEEIVKAAEKLNQFPFIIKHNRAGKGLGVQLLYTIDELKEYVEGPEFEESIDGITLVQQYVQPRDGHIVRSEFINGKFFYAVKVDSSDGFELCPADNCQINFDDAFCPVGEEAETPSKFEIQDGLVTEDQIIRYEQFLKDNNIAVAALEFIVDSEGEIYTYDVNTNTNYNPDAEAAADKYAMLELAHFLKEELVKAQAVTEK